MLFFNIIRPFNIYIYYILKVLFYFCICIIILKIPDRLIIKIAICESYGYLIKIILYEIHICIAHRLSPVNLNRFLYPHDIFVYAFYLIYSHSVFVFYNSISTSLKFYLIILEIKIHFKCNFWKIVVSSHFLYFLMNFCSLCHCVHCGS